MGDKSRRKVGHERQKCITKAVRIWGGGGGGQKWTVKRGSGKRQKREKSGPKTEAEEGEKGQKMTDKTGVEGDEIKQKKNLCYFTATKVHNCYYLVGWKAE